jgi:hypothetical protein
VHPNHDRNLIPTHVVHLLPVVMSIKNVVLVRTEKVKIVHLVPMMIVKMDYNVSVPATCLPGKYVVVVPLHCLGLWFVSLRSTRSIKQNKIDTMQEPNNNIT